MSYNDGWQDAEDAASKKVCGSCEHWLKFLPSRSHECRNIKVLDMLDYDNWCSFITPEEFSCALWGVKKETL